VKKIFLSFLFLFAFNFLSATDYYISNAGTHNFVVTDANGYSINVNVTVNNPQVVPNRVN
jgi:hypothetical protein